MAEEEATQPTQAATAAKCAFLGQHPRLCRFENIMAQKARQRDVQPDGRFQQSIWMRKAVCGQPVWNPRSSSKVTSKAKGGDATLFLLESTRSGLFHVENVPEDQMHPFLLIECPRD